MATYNRPLWLEKDGERKLYAAKDVADARANGWGDPKGARPNGEPWNPVKKEDERGQLDALEAVNEHRAKRDEKRAEVKAKDDAEKVAAMEKAAEAEPAADFKVEVVEKKAAAKSKK